MRRGAPAARLAGQPWCRTGKGYRHKAGYAGGVSLGWRAGCAFLLGDVQPVLFKV